MMVTEELHKNEKARSDWKSFKQTVRYLMWRRWKEEGYLEMEKFMNLNF
jgi:hypothetical protein